jgi:hypothetical protein
MFNISITPFARISVVKCIYYHMYELMCLICRNSPAVWCSLAFLEDSDDNEDTKHQPNSKEALTLAIRLQMLVDSSFHMSCMIGMGKIAYLTHTPSTATGLSQIHSLYGVQYHSFWAHFSNCL